MTSAGEVFPNRDLACTALIEFSKGGEGSGFFFLRNGNTFLVTAKHVLVNPETGILRDKEITITSESKDPTENNQNIIKVNLVTAQQSGRLKSNDSQDVTVVLLQKDSSGSGSEPVLLDGVEVIQKSKAGLIGVIEDKTSSFAKVSISNDVFVIGYPSSLGIRSTPQFDYTRPLLRKGIVAGKDNEARTIIIDSPVYFGNSGGPVFIKDQVALGIDNFYLIGVVKQFIPFVETWTNQTTKYQNISVSNSGYSVIAPTDVILELLKNWK